MKNLLSALLLVLFAFVVNGQTWEDNLPQDKLQNGSLTLHDYKKAFNDYWEPYNVKNGYYDVNGEKIKAPGWKLFKRWEWNAEHRIDSDGNFYNTSTVEEMEKYYQKYPEAGKSISGNWTNIGYNTSNGGYQGIGRVNCIAFHPTNNNIFWIGAPSGGLWITQNGGTSWSVLTDANTVLGVSAIAVTSNYATSNTIYIGTGDRDGGSAWALSGGNSHDNEGIGVLKSTDGGVSWTSSLSFTPSQKVVVHDLLIDPTNNSILYAATDAGIYKTTNGGTSWTQLNSSAYNDLEFQPGNSSIIFAAFKGTGWITKFTGGGASWTNLQVSTSSYRTELAVSANNSLVVYALTVNSGRGLEAIYKSTDAGATYTSVFNGSTIGNNLLGYDCNPSSTTGQGTYDVFITANPSNANDIYVGGINVWRSTNGGAAWTLKSHWTNSACGGTVQSVHADQHCCEFQNGSTVFIGNDGGIYKSIDNGSTWADLSNTLTINQIYRIGVAKNDPNEMIIGLQDNGTHLYSGGSWVMDGVIGGDGMECFIDPSNSNTQFGELNGGALKRTTNHWSSSSDITSGLSGTAPWVTPFIMDPNDNNTIYVGYQDVFKSTNQGSSWTQLSTWGGSTIRSLAVAPSNSNYIYSATQTTLQKSSDGGTSWTNITTGLPTSGNITYIAVKGDDPSTVWVTIGGFNSDAVYQTTNGGTSWTNISTGLPQLPAMSVVQNVLNTGKIELYVAMTQGVWVKYGSANWIPFKTGLPNVFCTELEIYYDNTTPSNSKIRVGTFGRGLWESPIPIVDFMANNTIPASSATQVVLTDLSTNSPTGWLWTFSPNTVTFMLGSNANSQNPTVQFNNPGAYTVSLTTTNAFGNDSEVKTTYVHMGTPGLWMGTTSVDWSTGINWHNHQIPTSATGVTLNPGPTNWPTFNGNFNVGTQCGALSMSGNSEFTVTGDLTIPSGSQILCNANSIINVEGDFINYGLFTPGNSVVKMNGNTNSSITGNITNNGNQSTAPFVGTGWVYHGAYFDVVASGGKNITVNSLDFHCNTTGNVNVEVWYTTGTYTGQTSNPGAWTQLGTTQSITGQGAWTPTTVNPGASVTIPSGSTYGLFINCYSGSSGYIWFSGGSNTYSNSDITVNTGDMAGGIPVGSGAWNGYTVNATVNYSYITSNPLSFFDLEINKSNALVTTDGNLNIGNDFTIHPGAHFTNSTGDALNVNGNTFFMADASGMASFIDNGISVFTTAPMVQQYLSNNKWHFVSIPVTGALSGVYNGTYLRTFNEPTDSWNSYITGTTVPLDNTMIGYAAWAAGSPATTVFNGPLKNGTFTIPVTSQSSGSNSGWNLVGNPYPSSLDWDATGWSKTAIDNTIYYYSGSTGLSNYYYYVGSGTAPFVAANNGTNEIPPQQGFFVHATANGNFGVNNNARIHSGQAFYKETIENDIPLIRIEAEGNGLTDETVVRFFTEANAEFDSDFDAYKLFANDYPQVYTTTPSGTELAISSLPEITNDLVVPIAFSAPLDVTYTFNFIELVGFDELGDLYLEDLLANKIVEVDENLVYVFEHSIENTNDRFLLHFSNPLGVDNNIDDQQVSIYSYNNVVYIQKPVNFDGKVFIYDILGKEIYGAKSQSEGLISIPVTNGMGYYLVKVQSNNAFKTKKVFIK